jgi:hypothetical protein
MPCEEFVKAKGDSSSGNVPSFGEFLENIFHTTWSSASPVRVLGLKGLEGSDRLMS